MPFILKPLAAQRIVITGASSGIGLATARMAAERGAKVVLPAAGAMAFGMSSPSSGNGRSRSGRRTHNASR